MTPTPRLTLSGVSADGTDSDAIVAAEALARPALVWYMSAAMTTLAELMVMAMSSTVRLTRLASLVRKSSCAAASKDSTVPTQVKETWAMKRHEAPAGTGGGGTGGGDGGDGGGFGGDGGGDGGDGGEGGGGLGVQTTLMEEEPTKAFVSVFLYCQSTPVTSDGQRKLPYTWRLEPVAAVFMYQLSTTQPHPASKR